MPENLLLEEDISIRDMIESYMDEDNNSNSVERKSRYDNVFSFYSARKKAELKLPEKGDVYYWIDLDTYDVRHKKWTEEANDYLRFSTYNIYHTYEEAVLVFIRMHDFYTQRGVEIKLDYNKSLEKLYRVIWSKKKDN